MNKWRVVKSLLALQVKSSQVIVSFASLIVSFTSQVIVSFASLIVSFTSQVWLLALQQSSTDC